jgi:hypothetical protein
MSACFGPRIGINGSETINLDNFRVNVEHSMTYVVVMTTGPGLTGSRDSLAREDQVLLVPGVPALGAASEIAPGAFCNRRSPVEIGQGVWEVECTFDNTALRPNEMNQEPWDLTPTWQWSAETIEVPLIYDAQDPTRPILNSAGEQLPPLTTPESVPVLTISRAELYFDHIQIQSYMNRVNSQPFWGWSANQVLCSEITAQQQRKDTTRYWQVEYRFKFWYNGGEGWRIKLLDEGTYYWTGGTKGTGTRRPFGDDAFQQVTGNLNGSGGINTSLSTPVFITPAFNRYQSVDFNVLGLGPWSWA